MPDRTGGAYRRNQPKANVVISDITTKTGGKVFPISEAKEAAKFICDELHKNRYLLSYFPTNFSSYDARRVFLIGDEGIEIRTKLQQPPNIKWTQVSNKIRQSSLCRIFYWMHYKSEICFKLSAWKICVIVKLGVSQTFVRAFPIIRYFRFRIESAFFGERISFVFILRQDITAGRTSRNFIFAFFSASIG